MKHRLVGLIGHKRAGKDTLALALKQAGYQRRCKGDLIKASLDAKIRKQFGFSAFTEVDEEKDQIRDILREHGIKNAALFSHFFYQSASKVPTINTRLVPVPEIVEFKRHGGVIVEIIRDEAERQLDSDVMEAVRLNLVDYIVYNDNVDEASAALLYFAITGKKLLIC